MTIYLIPGKGYIKKPNTSGLYIIPGKGYIPSSILELEAFFGNKTNQITCGVVAQTAVQLNGVLVT